MKAMILEHQTSIDESPLILVDLATPVPGEREIRVRVHCCAICRTDLHVIEGDLPARKKRVIPGHQIVGHVEALGPHAQRFPIGARVGIAWLRKTCGVCAYCEIGQENLCESPEFTGYHAHGGFAEYACVHEDYAYAIPDVFEDAEAAPLLCAGIIGYRALKRAELPASGRLGIFGFGSSAHIVTQIARYRGCEVFVKTRGALHQALARQLGARWVGGPDDTFPEKVDSAIIFAPAGELVPAALEVLKKGGTLALAGIHMSDIPAMNYEQHLFYEKNLRSVTANTRDDGMELLKVAAAIPLRPQLHMYALEDANQALQDLKADRIQGTGCLQIADVL
jgi:propanol-preferring alcohol dehydrogenase